MSRPRDKQALRRAERRLGELRALPARTQAQVTGQAAPAVAGALATVVVLAAIGLRVATAPLAAAWGHAAEARLVVVPDPALPAAGDATLTRLAAVERIAGAAATDNASAALGRLLGPGIDAATLPGLVTLPAAADPGLAARIAAAAPGATIATPPPAASAGLVRLHTTLDAAIRLLLLAATLAAIACLHLGARFATDPSAPSLRILAQLGERPRTLARRAAWRTGMWAATGAVGAAALSWPLLRWLAGSPTPASAAAVLAPLGCGAVAALLAGARAHAAATSWERP